MPGEPSPVGAVHRVVAGPRPARRSRCAGSRRRPARSPAGRSSRTVRTAPPARRSGGPGASAPRAPSGPASIGATDVGPHDHPGRRVDRGVTDAHRTLVDVEHARDGGGARRGDRPRRARFEREVPDGDVGVGPRRPRVGGRRRCAVAVELAGDDRRPSVARPRSSRAATTGVSRAHSIEKCGSTSFDSAGRLSQIWNSSSGFGASASSSGNISECTMPAPGGEPLRVAAPEARRRAQRVGVVDQAAAHVGDGLEPAVRMLREPGHLEPVVHPPPVDAGEVGAELAPRQRRRRARTARCPPGTRRRGARRTGTGRSSATGCR